jgi:hypothetical protein
MPPLMQAKRVSPCKFDAVGCAGQVAREGADRAIIAALIDAVAPGIADEIALADGIVLHAFGAVVLGGKRCRNGEEQG